MMYNKRNFKSIGNLIEPLVKRHGQLNIISYAKLLDIWDTIVGEEISKKAYPIKMKTIRGGEKNILYLKYVSKHLYNSTKFFVNVIWKNTICNSEFIESEDNFYFCDWRKTLS